MYGGVTSGQGTIPEHGVIHQWRTLCPLIIFGDFCGWIMVVVAVLFGVYIYFRHIVLARSCIGLIFGKQDIVREYSK
jgi:hypothetical protein